MPGVPGDLVCRVDVRGLVTSAEGGEGLPWRASELPGRPLAEILPDDAARELADALPLAAAGGVLDCPACFRRKTLEETRDAAGRSDPGTQLTLV
jgi:hypothetical protein